MGMYKKIDNNTLQKLSGYTVVADGSCAEIRKGYITMSSDSSAPQSCLIQTMMLL